jgi:hypothetical protein
LSKKNKIEDKFDKLLAERLDSWTDEECLFNLSKFFTRCHMTTEFVQDNESGYITHELLLVLCGDKVIPSAPIPLDWPLQPIEFPEDEAKAAGVSMN